MRPQGIHGAFTRPRRQRADKRAGAAGESGTTEERASRSANLKEAIALEKRRKHKNNLTIRLPQEEIERLDKKAEEEARTRSGLVRKIIRDYLASTLPSHPE